MERGPNLEPGMKGEPSSVGAPTTAMSASSSPRSAQMAARRNDGIPTNGMSIRRLPPSGITVLLGMLRRVASLADDRFVLVPAREGRAVPLAAGGRIARLGPCADRAR